MKTLFFLIGVSCFFRMNAQKRISLDSAIQQKQIAIEIEITGRNGSPNNDKMNSNFFGSCMLMTIKNICNNPLILTINPGLMLMSEDPSVQDMIVTKKRVVNIPPNTQLKIAVHAMCTEIEDNSPTFEDSYTIGKMANPSLVKLAENLALENRQDYIGQIAIWGYANQITYAQAKLYLPYMDSIQKSVEILDALHLEHQLKLPDRHSKQDSKKAVIPLVSTKHDEPKSTQETAPVATTKKVIVTKVELNTTLQNDKKQESPSKVPFLLNLSTGLIIGFSLFWFFLLLFRRRKKEEEEEQMTPRLQRV